MIDDDFLFVLVAIVGIAAVILTIFWIRGDFEKTPAQRAGFPDPPPTCERGEVPRRIFLSNGAHVMTCEVRP